MWYRFDKSILLSVFTLAALGVVQVYSSSFILATESYGDGHYFFRRQIIFVVMGLGLLFVTAALPRGLFEKFGFLFWLVSAMGVVLTLVPGIGVKVGGASRWIALGGGFRIEPSEFLKVSLPLVFASLLTWRSKIRGDSLASDASPAHSRRPDQRAIGWAKPSRAAGALRRREPFFWIVSASFIGGPLVLLLFQPDFGSFVICALVLLALLFAFGLPWKWLVGTAVAMVPAFYFLVVRVPYRWARVVAFMDPWSDPGQKGFQVIQSLLSFRSGGVLGQGLGQGQGKLYFLPEAHTDFTLAVVGEELGLLGFLLLLSLYGFLIFRTLQLSLRSPSIYQRAVILGLSLVFSISVAVNMGVVLGILPPKGLTLPFLSYGGSSVLAMFFAFGLVLNSSVRDGVKRGR